MPLILAPSFDDHTRAEVEKFLDEVRARRIAAVIEFQQSKMTKLGKEHSEIKTKLSRQYEHLGKALERLAGEIDKVEGYLAVCQMLRSEMGLVYDRIQLAKK